MKNSPLLVTLLAATAFAAGCDKGPTTAQQVDRVQTETKQAVQDMKDYTFAEKAEFVKAMQDQLAALNRDLDQLAAKIASSSEAVKAEAQPKLAALRAQAAQLTHQLAGVQNATESTWDSVKAGTKQACDSAERGFTEVRQWLSDKIAP
jgi:septal ring factor EnvC (AmiA/AmiB activator)